MELKQLRYFVAVAEELHFGRAARRLFISQPALSFDIRKFEEQLGVQLLERTNRAVALTNAGNVLLEEARRLLEQAEEVRCIAARSAHGLAGRLRIGFVNSMLYRGLPEAVRRFEVDHPAVEVVLREMNTAEQVQALQRLQIDLGFAHWGRFPAEVRSDVLFSEPFLCCLPEGHRLARKRRIELATLAREPFILFPRSVSPHYHDQIIATCVEAGFSPQIRHEARLWQTVVTMVEFGMGIALVPAALGAAGGARVVFRPLASNPYESQVLRLVRAGEANALAQGFASCLAGREEGGAGAAPPRK
ncbi:LysR family transcriptional regulator [Paraburkholderia lycopersici]|uniref:DNA-binding transcriptional regulator, LysR family n=1 Tax=Paraburkholderia lycopersici TaxID=416944 RepID=A0A1G6XH55_9BURK|nr:LysR family transcriptional regulator [Paraburkholderia lycopersici]SDD77392.1 DNA-binding transcriptional regulator, LysR family [Paraburkholderia lycopersici]